MIAAEKIFSDHMVLQREMPVPVWGTYENAEQIWVSLGEAKTEAKREKNRFWAVLPPFPAGTGLVLKIWAKSEGEEEALVFEDVVVGEVWVAAGQSNMEFPLRYDSEGEMVMHTANDGLFRYYDVPKISYEGQEKDRSYEDYGIWRSFDGEGSGWFSAAAAYFGIRLRQELSVPVGIIGCNWGATSASCWMERRYLEEYPELSYYLESYEKAVAGLDLVWYRDAFLEKQKFGLTPYVKEKEEALNRGTLSQEEILSFLSGLTERQKELFSLPAGPMDHTRPCILYETMVKRIAGYGARGVIWYQGEADEVLPKQYALLFSQLVRCFRDSFGQKLPFVCVQLAPFGHWLSSTGKEFPEIRRQQQRSAALLDQVWLAGIMDAGMETDIHPKSKRAAGERMALLALGKIYGKPGLCEAPEFADADWEENRITLYFSHAGEGLSCGAEIPAGLELWEDGKSREFLAEVTGNRIILYVDGLSEASHVQVNYAQRPYLKADLYNSAGLCAKPFRAVRPYDWKEEFFHEGI